MFFLPLVTEANIQLILGYNMYLLKETTNWEDGNPQNGVYIFESKPTGRLAKAIGYINRISDEAKFFVKPMDIDMKYRTFVPIGKPLE